MLQQFREVPCRVLKRSKLSVASVAIGLTAVVGTIGDATTALAASFPDIENHWSQPFVDRLSEEDVLAGYLDGTFRPEQPVRRDEFAAIIRQAFNQEQERRLASGSVYQDIPSDYWAAPAIEEVYEMGFMSGYPGGVFRPDQEVSKVEAIVSLMNVLNLPPSDSGVSVGSVGTQTETRSVDQPAQNQPANRQNVRTKRPLLFPLAMTALMQPVLATQRIIQSPPASNTPATTGTPAATDVPAADTPETATAPSSEVPVSTPPGQTPPSFTVSNYYQDANSIPQYAIDAVAAATRANVVVNYPDPTILNPTQPATRAEVAALVHQVFVQQGKLEPIAGDVEATRYVVDSLPGDTQQ
ncbi:MAG: S-layer homology domain-containing protein [Cyanobacteria bacterium RM1_2_2]|nr:S-layer homology domain-containing protein [Cyanobacteria bacterium RM1_2_2]